jgi:predicted esterase
MMIRDESIDTINSTNVRNYNFGQKLLYSVMKISWWIWPVIVEKLVLRLFFSPSKYKLNPVEQALLNRGKNFQIKVRNKMIQCWQWGEGPMVILAHGWNGRGAQFQPLIEALIDAKFSVVTYDAPGHGDSEGKTSNYFEFSDTVRTLWHLLDNDKVHAVIGHSLGAAAVLNFMSKEKYNKKAILIAPALRLRELLFQTFEYHHIPKIVYLNLVQNLEMIHGYNIFNDNPSQLIKKMKNNIMIFHDKNDRAVPYADTEHAAEMLDNITLCASSGLGHKRILNDHSTISAAVNYFQNGKRSTNSIQKAS